MLGPFSNAKTITSTEVPVSVQAVATMVIESAQKLQGLKYWMDFAGVSTESQNIIQKDIETNTSPRALSAQMTIESDHVLLDGTDTGIRISSYSPYNISYRGKIWIYKKNLTVDANYFSLKKFLTSNPNAQLWRSFFPLAEAAEAPRTGTAGAGVGLTLGFIPAAFIGGLIAAGVIVATPALVAAAGVSLVAGGLAGWRIGDKKEKKDKALAGRVLYSDPVCKCSAEKVSIQFSKGPARIEMDRKKVKTPIQLFDEKGVMVPVEKVPDRQEGLMAQIFNDCKTQSDAAKLCGQLKQYQPAKSESERSRAPSGPSKSSRGADGA